MLVKNWMSTQIQTVKEEDSLAHVIEVMRKYEIRILPVMHNGQIVGIISDRDVKKVSIPEHVPPGTIFSENHTLSAGSVMTKGAISVSPLHTVEEAAELLLVNKISGVPVLDESRKLVGIITQSDLFRAMVSMTGIGKKGFQFGFYVRDEPGCIRNLTDTFRDYGGRIASIMATSERCERGYRRIYIRAYNLDGPSLERVKEVLSEKATIVYVVDHLNKKREIYEDPPTENSKIHNQEV